MAVSVWGQVVRLAANGSRDLGGTLAKQGFHYSLLRALWRLAKYGLSGLRTMLCLREHELLGFIIVLGA